jgi:integrase
VVWAAERISEWQRTGIRPSVAVWTPAQTAAFLNAIQGHRLYAAYHLIALRGLRRGEAAGLRCCDVDLDTGTAIISWQLQQYDGHVALCPPKTAHSERIIALDRTTVAALHAHRARQLAEGAAAGEDYLNSGYVFTRLNGDPMAPDFIASGCLIHGTRERRRPAWRTLGQRAHTLLTAGLSHAHPARQICRPHRQAPASLTQRGTPTVLPSIAENGPAAWAAIPWPTSARTASTLRA